jgi:hypothetical protein
MSDLREQKPVLACTLPVNNPNLAPEIFNGRGCYSRVPCHACGVQYDRREIEQYSHPHAIHVSRFVCPRGPGRSAATLGAGASTLRLWALGGCEK